MKLDTVAADVLCALHDAEGMAPGPALARLTGHPRAVVRGALERLAGEGLVVRVQADGADNGAVYVPETGRYARGWSITWGGAQMVQTKLRAA